MLHHLEKNLLPDPMEDINKWGTFHTAENFYHDNHVSNEQAYINVISFYVVYAFNNTIVLRHQIQRVVQ